MLKRSALVTGGAGFLGSHIVERLVTEDFDVTVVDDLSRGIYVHGDFRFVEGDINQGDVFQDLDRADLVVHCAALCGVERIIDDPRHSLDDFVGTQQVCRFAVERGVDSMIFMSSSEIYGSEAFDVREEDDIALWNVHEGRTNYALAKLMGEALTLSLPMQTTVVRPFNVFGSRQLGPSALKNFFDRATRGQPLEIYNDGTEIRALCYIDDFVDGCWRCIDRAGPSRIYNLGNPANATPVCDLAHSVIDLTVSSSPITHVKKSYPDRRAVVPNIDRSRREIGFSPRVSLDAGLTSMLSADSLADVPA